MTMLVLGVCIVRIVAYSTVEESESRYPLKMLAIKPYRTSCRLSAMLSRESRECAQTSP